MSNKKITAKQLEMVLRKDFNRLVEEVAEAMNSAQPGRIIADSEEPVRNASAVFREQLYQKAMNLLQNKQEAFFPSEDSQASLEE